MKITSIPRKTFFTCSLTAITLLLASWGFKGHRAVASIAQKHLTSNTAYVVAAYLRGERMADVSTWADENRNPKTAPWHFLNLPLGLTHEQFVKAVTESDNNVYSAILKTEAQLKDKSLSTDEKNEALKYLIHLVGDAHQPMHISRKEDKGGNTIQVRFDGKGTNLHSLWDSKLIDHEGKSEADIAKDYDTATPADIKKWQADSPMEWIWESYQISSELYANIKSGQTIDEAYYNKYIPTIRKRIDQAGIRLAGELNKLFNNEPVPQISSTAQTIQSGPTTAQTVAVITTIKAEEAKNNIGKTVTVNGKTYSSKDIGSMILVNMGAAYPNQLLTIAIKGEAKASADSLEGKTITVTGQLINYKGKPEIIVTDPNQLKIQ
ncbi:S1/P1 nuclease [Mucilaginibacter yixingensis]|uniref:S1/P1 nuclease n=1 Tax=Mucilaginibacter yixingensis TaxID=1295612 RepID=A0A2T5J4L4_9SPHI|nr:S1/P1 nuclease [Mucilaginibacter yixingensis]PTQ92407.1 S1/P1 nuclease [Mucilaginibacter yixingensis]